MKKFTFCLISAGQIFHDDYVGEQYIYHETSHGYRVTVEAAGETVHEIFVSSHDTLTITSTHVL